MTFKPYYQDTAVTIFCGDCREIVPTLGRFDLLLTDPPYGVKRDKGFGGFGGFGKPIARKRFEDDNWDADRPDKETFDLIIAAASASLIWGGNFFADLLPRSTHWIFWDKLQTMPTFGDGELAWTNSPRKSVKKVTVEYNGLIGKEAGRSHPTQKPIRLLTWCVEKYSEAGQTILDPFAGSGTTGRAAKDLGRKCVLIEREERYCEIAARRMSQEVFDLN
jgi:DNA modification methylase